MRRSTFREIWIGATGTVALVWLGMNLNQGEKFGPPGGRSEADIENIKTLLNRYLAMTGCLPSTEQGLKALVEHPTGEPQPAHWRQVMPELPRDSWGMAYQYRRPALKSSKDPYDVFSCGKDRLPNTEDDIGNW